MDIQEYLNNNNIKQIYISEGLYDNKNNFLLNIKYEEYKDYKHKNEPVLFWGVYHLIDYKQILNHIGDKFIFWGGKDADIRNKNRLKLISNIRNVKEHLCINKYTYNNLINIFSNVRDISKKPFSIKQLENPDMSDTKYVNISYAKNSKKHFEYFDWEKYKNIHNLTGYGNKYGVDIDKNLCWHHCMNFRANDNVYMYLKNDYFKNCVNNKIIIEHIESKNNINSDFLNKKIFYFGQIGTTGYAKVINNNIYILKLLGFDISFEIARTINVNYDDMNNIKNAIQLDCINKFDGNSADFIFYHDSVADLNNFATKYPNKKIIVFIHWETDKLPENWKYNLDNHADIVIYASSYNYTNNTVKSKCNFIECFIDSNIKSISTTMNEKLTEFSKYKIKFYFIGQWNFRKDIIRLINIYKETFSNNYDVCLFIKTFHGCPSKYDLTEFENSNPRIIIDTSLYSESEMDTIYQIGDCFINCSHNEDPGLSVIMSSITTDLISMNIGGHTDYIYDYIKLENNTLEKIDTVVRHIIMASSIIIILIINRIKNGIIIITMN